MYTGSEAFADTADDSAKEVAQRPAEGAQEFPGKPVFILPRVPEKPSGYLF